MRLAPGAAALLTALAAFAGPARAEPLLPAYTDREVSAMMWAAEGCMEPLGAVLGMRAPNDGSACPAHQMDFTEARRIATLGERSGEVRWCDDRQALWGPSLDRAVLDSKGQATSPAVRTYAAMLHGIAQGVARRRLWEAFPGGCTGDQRKAAGFAFVELIGADIAATRH
jgi:hypothetical protein